MVPWSLLLLSASFGYLRLQLTAEVVGVAEDAVEDAVGGRAVFKKKSSVNSWASDSRKVKDVCRGHTSAQGSMLR